MAANGGFRPLIFISHSAREDPEAYASLVAVRDYLGQQGFHVLIDETSIEGNDEWRNCINTWLALCHGAVILLSKKALRSDWVKKEAAILSGRPWRSQPNEFKLLSVLFGTTAEEVKGTTGFNILELTDYQALMNLR